MSIVRLQQTIAEETMFPPRAPFFLRAWGTSPRACVYVWGNLPVPPDPFHCSASRTRRSRAFPTPLPAHAPGTGA